MTHNDVMPIFRFLLEGFLNKFKFHPVSLDLDYFLPCLRSAIGELFRRNFDEFTPKFVNKMNWLQLQYCVEKNKRISVFVRVYRKESEKETMKSAIYVT